MRQLTIILPFALSLVSDAGWAQLPSWPLRSPGDELVDQAASARARSEFSLAAALLDAAEAEIDPPRARILHERGLLARARGHLDDALRHLHAAAEAEPNSTARVDHAGVLVQMGRWPEAVVVLRRAFEESGSMLRVDDLVTDPRFVKLSGFEPYQVLIERVRAEQSGPLAQLLLRLNRIETSSATSARVLERMAAVHTFVWRLGSSLAAPIVLLVFLGLITSFGVAQLRLVRAPWTLVIGMLIACGVWHAGARIATAGASGGWQTIGIALATVIGPWLMVLAVRFLWRWRREAVARASNPFAREHLPHTLAILEEVARLGRRWLEADDEERDAAAREMQLAQEALRQRLRGEHEPAAQ